MAKPARGRGPGQPTKLTEALIGDFCAKLRVSGSIETACLAAHISRQSFYAWRTQCREGTATPLIRKFLLEVENAEAACKMDREHRLRVPGKYWQGLAWWLERKYSNEYGQRHPLPLPDGDAIAERKVDRVIWMDDDDEALDPVLLLTPPKILPQLAAPAGPAEHPEPVSELAT